MDTENLAIVFGSNLIRPAEEPDMNTIKEYNCKLIPLIKVLIDQSEYLFPVRTSFFKRKFLSKIFYLRQIQMIHVNNIMNQ